MNCFCLIPVKYNIATQYLKKGCLQKQIFFDESFKYVVIYTQLLKSQLKKVHNFEKAQTYSTLIKVKFKNKAGMHKTVNSQTCTTNHSVLFGFIFQKLPYRVFCNFR